MDELAKKIVDGYSAMKAERGTFDNSLQDITWYVLPEYESQNESQRGEEGDVRRPVSSTATNAAILLGGHLFSHTVNTGDEWFTLRVLGDDDSGREAKEWLSHAQKKAIRAIQNSNFAEAFGEMCTLYGTYGTGCLSTEYDDERAELVFRNHSINGNVYFTEDHRGRVNGVYRLIRYTADQAAQRYGADNLPKEVKNCVGDPSKANEKHDFIQAVTPNPDVDFKRRDVDSMPYRSIHVHQESCEVVLKSGFRTFPFACPRFIKLRDFSYGYGAGHQAMRAVRELNKAEADFIDAVEMESHPPMWLPDEEAVEVAEMRPNFVGYFDPSQGAPFQLKTNSNAQALFQRILQLRQEIEQMFFIDVFLSVSSNRARDKTAREVDEIAEEKLSSIGPMISRLQSECFGPMIERIVDELIENGVIDSPPESIAGEGFRVVYTSRIDSKLASIEVAQTLRAAQEAAGLIALQEQAPEIGDVMRLKDAAQMTLEKRNVHMDLIIPKAKRAEMEQARAEAREQAEAKESAEKLVKPADPMKSPEQGSMAEAMMNQ